jgi:ubiquinone/menaquinone biosynthesis C-methylase UbiE
MNIITRTTELAMTITLAYIRRGDTIIDATCGTGRDTVTLARAAGAEGKVYAFDIQPEAIAQTKKRLDEEGLSNVKLIQGSFLTMGSYIPEASATAVAFNLGYLPGGDHSITTKAEESLEGLKLALRMIRSGGIVTVVLYDGHEERAKEKKRILDWSETLDSGKYHVAYVSFTNQKNDPPEILWITRKRDE